MTLRALFNRLRRNDGPSDWDLYLQVAAQRDHWRERALAAEGALERKARL